MVNGRDKFDECFYLIKVEEKGGGHGSRGGRVV